MNRNKIRICHALYTYNIKTKIGSKFNSIIQNKTFFYYIYLKNIFFNTIKK